MTSMDREPLDMDLAEFARHVDETLGRPTEFAVSLAAWRKASTTVNRWAGRGAGLAAVHTAIEHNIRDQGGESNVVVGRGRQVIQRRYREPRVSRRILSAKVQGVDRELWNASRVPILRLANFTTETERAVWTPAPVRGRETQDLPAHLDRIKQWASNSRAAAKEHGAVVKAVVTELHDAGQWEAQQCFVLRDGWELGFTTGLRFDAAKTLDLLNSGDYQVPNLDRLMGDSTRKGGFEYRVVDRDEVQAGDDESGWDDELDEIDGD